MTDLAPLAAPPAPAIWMRCRQCGRRLVALDVADGRTCLRLLGVVVVLRADVQCPACGHTRRFESAPYRPAATPRT